MQKDFLEGQISSPRAALAQLTGIPVGYMQFRAVPTLFFSLLGQKHVIIFICARKMKTNNKIYTNFPLEQDTSIKVFFVCLVKRSDEI